MQCLILETIDCVTIRKLTTYNEEEENERYQGVEVYLTEVAAPGSVVDRRHCRVLLHPMSPSFECLE